MFLSASCPDESVFRAKMCRTQRKLDKTRCFAGINKVSGGKLQIVVFAFSLVIDFESGDGAPVNTVIRIENEFPGFFRQAGIIYSKCRGFDSAGFFVARESLL